MEEYNLYLNEMQKNNKSVHTIRAYKKSFEYFFNFFKITDIAQIRKLKQRDIRVFRNSLNDGGMSNVSVNSHIRHISAFLHWLKKNEYISKIVTEDLEALKEEQKIPVYLNDDETYRMIENCETLQEKVMVALMIATGIRVGEVVAIKVTDIRNGTILIHGKGKKERELAIHPSVMTLLDGYLKNHSSEYLFTAMNGRSKGELTTDAIRLRVKKAANLAGIDPERIEKISPHKIRHTTATNLVSRGIDIRVIQAILGHSSVTTTANKYAHVRNKVMADALTNTKLW